MKRTLTGVTATAAIIILVVGIPIGLYISGGAPWPQTAPTLDGIIGALTSPDDGTAFLAVLKVAGWVAWISFTAVVVLEIAAQVSGMKVRSIPALGLQQKAAAGLVGAAALLFIAAPMTSAGTASASTPTAMSSMAISFQHSDSHSPTTETQHDADSRPDSENSKTHKAPAAPTKDYVVRAGDTLWSIAETTLGDGARFPEIARLNYHQVQVDGGALTSEHWIQPGWTLQVPTAHPAAAASVEQRITIEQGDSLSSIALDKLGDSQLWPDIYEASRDLEQPANTRLTDPDVVLPGWTVVVPGTAATGEVQPHDVKSAEEKTPHQKKNVTSHAANEANEAEDAEDAEASRAAMSREIVPDGSLNFIADLVEDATHGEVAGASPETDIDAADADMFQIRTAAGVGALLAAGVLGLITVRRQRQRRRHRPGQQLALPTGDTAAVEQELRATADPLSVETVDIALRTLAARCAETGQPLPIVRAGRLTADQFDLYLAEPAYLPPPWEGTVDSTVWTLSGDAEDQLGAEDALHVPAPYPALVTIGHDDEDGHVFLDLEHIGSLGVNGDPEHTRQVLAAIAVELATSRWADDLQVTIVGAYPELEDSLETGCIRYLPTAGRLLEELQRRADIDRAQLESTGGGDLQHARVARTAPGAWTPEIVLLAGEITETHRQQLDELVNQLPRVAIAAVTHGQVVGEWTITLDQPQSGTLEPIGLRLRPQLLDDATYAQILTMLATADADLTDPDPTARRRATPEPKMSDLPVQGATADLEDEEAGGKTDADDEHQVDEEVSAEGVAETGGADADNVQLGDVVFLQHVATEPDQQNSKEEPVEEVSLPGARPETVSLLPRRGPRILMLGSVEMVDANGTVETSKRARLTELAAFLATHPGCDHTLIDNAQWPGARVSDNSRNTAISKLRRWMGKTAAGDEFLPRYQASDRYRMHEDVTTDWQQWQLLLPEGPEEATTTAIEEALQLVRGRPFDGTKARRYAWAENLRNEMMIAILDATYELARRRLMEGRWREAGSAAVRGLELEPAYEPLWRIRILAAHAAGQPNAVNEAVDRLLGVAEGWGGDLEDETEELLESLKSDPPTRKQFANEIV